MQAKSVLSLLLAGGLAIAISSSDALAEAGGNGKGNGQGASRSAGHGPKGGASVASAGNGLAKGKTGSLHASKLGRLNSVLNSSASAWAHASANSPIGIIAQEYAAALDGFDDAAVSEKPTVESLAAILAKVANKEEITPETLDLIHQRLVHETLIEETDLDQASALLAPPSTDETIAAPTLSAVLAEQANLVEADDVNAGLGSIY